MNVFTLLVFNQTSLFPLQHCIAQSRWLDSRYTSGLKSKKICNFRANLEKKLNFCTDVYQRHHFIFLFFCCNVAPAESGFPAQEDDVKNLVHQGVEHALALHFFATSVSCKVGATILYYRDLLTSHI